MVMFKGIIYTNYFDTSLKYLSRFSLFDWYTLCLESELSGTVLVIHFPSHVALLSILSSYICRHIDMYLLG